MFIGFLLSYFLKIALVFITLHNECPAKWFLVQKLSVQCKTLEIWII